MTRQKAGRWRERFAASGLAGILQDRPGRGRKAVISSEQRHQEWLKFLKLIDTSTPEDKELHLIVDNGSTHKHDILAKVTWARQKLDSLRH